MMDWRNQAELKSQRFKYNNVTQREFLLLPKNLVILQLDVEKVHGGENSHSQAWPPGITVYLSEHRKGSSRCNS